MANFWHSKSVVLPVVLKGYAFQGHQLSETDIVNVLQQKNFEEEFEQIMEGTNSQLQEHFRYIASSQQVSHPPSDWENAKKVFIEITEAAERYHYHNYND